MLLVEFMGEQLGYQICLGKTYKTGKIYQITIKYTKRKIDQTAIKYTNIFDCKTLKIDPNRDFDFEKYAMWQTCIPVLYVAKIMNGVLSTFFARGATVSASAAFVAHFLVH
jgi:hypothetical protein